jgi:hypothetical protein
MAYQYKIVRESLFDDLKAKINKKLSYVKERIIQEKFISLN